MALKIIMISAMDWICWAEMRRRNGLCYGKMSLKPMKENDTQVGGGSLLWEQKSLKAKEVEDPPVPITNNGLRDYSDKKDELCLWKMKMEEPKMRLPSSWQWFANEGENKRRLDKLKKLRTGQFQ